MKSWWVDYVFGGEGQTNPVRKEDIITHIILTSEFQCSTNQQLPEFIKFLKLV